MARDMGYRPTDLCDRARELVDAIIAKSPAEAGGIEDLPGSGRGYVWQAVELGEWPPPAGRSDCMFGHTFGTAASFAEYFAPWQQALDRARAKMSSNARRHDGQGQYS